MSSKEEVAALMAHGDAETKISLLKKAVVSVTKQKQLFEQHNKQLQDQMAAIGEELAQMQEENRALQRKLKAVEEELETERKRGYFASSMKTTLKGISSFVTGTDGEETRTMPKRPKDPGLPLKLSPEDQEKLILENESLHMQLFDLRKKYEDERQTWRVESEQRLSECSAMEVEVTELRGLLDSTTQACDHLNVECARQAALVMFCHHFFVLSWETAKEKEGEGKQKRLQIAVTPSLATKGGGIPPCRVREELAAESLTGAMNFVRTLMSAVSVLVASLRDSFSTQLRGITLGDMRCYRDRLSTLLEAHGVQKATILYHVKELEDAFNALMEPIEKLTEIQRIQSLLISSFNSWLGLMCKHMRLLIDVCIKLGSYDTNGNKENTQPVIDSTIVKATGAVATIHGSLEALNHLCDVSSGLLRQEGCDAAEWLLALERFWWEGCSASVSLWGAVESLRELLKDMTASIKNNDHVRNALEFIYKSLKALSVYAGGGTTRDCWPQSKTETQRALSPTDIPANATNTSSFTSADNKELLAALAAVDRAAVCYHTQMNYTLLELAEKQESLANAQQEVKRLMVLNQQQEEDAERVREALETQIRLLSDQLVEFTNNSGGRNGW